MEEMLAKLGLSLAHLVSGLIGGVVGLIFGKKTVRTAKDKLRAFFVILAGAIVTGYITPLVFMWKPSWENAEYSIGFVIGLMGMGVIEGLINLITQFKTSPIDTIKDIKDTIKKD